MLPSNAVDAVDDRRVGLQRHAEAQPVQEDGRHEGPLLGRRGLALDDARERDRLQRRERRAAAPPAVSSPQTFSNCRCIARITSAAVGRQPGRA